jgi:hypothetical protein
LAALVVVGIYSLVAAGAIVAVTIKAATHAHVAGGGGSNGGRGGGGYRPQFKNARGNSLAFPPASVRDRRLAAYTTPLPRGKSTASQTR